MWRLDGCPPRTPLAEARQLWVELVTEHRVFVLASADARGLWTAPLFFRCDESRTKLFFLSSPASRHARATADGAHCAGSFYSAPGPVAQIRGAQFEGNVRPVAARDQGAVEALFAATFSPEEAAVRRHADVVPYEFRVSRVQLVDNRVAFGWKAELPMEVGR